MRLVRHVWTGPLEWTRAETSRAAMTGRRLVEPLPHPIAATTPHSRYHTPWPLSHPIAAITGRRLLDRYDTPRSALLAFAMTPSTSLRGRRLVELTEGCHSEGFSGVATVNKVTPFSLGYPHYQFSVKTLLSKGSTDSHVL